MYFMVLLCQHFDFIITGTVKTRYFALDKSVKVEVCVLFKSGLDVPLMLKPASATYAMLTMSSVIVYSDPIQLVSVYPAWLR